MNNPNILSDVCFESVLCSTPFCFPQIIKQKNFCSVQKQFLSKVKICTHFCLLITVNNFIPNFASFTSLSYDFPYYCFLQFLPARYKQTENNEKKWDSKKLKKDF